MVWYAELERTFISKGIAWGWDIGIVALDIIVFGFEHFLFEGKMRKLSVKFSHKITLLWGGGLILH